MTSAIADSVLAATHKLVQQAMQGEWQDVPKTVEQRRVLLERLTANASARDQQWLGALQQAMAESDAAVAKMAAVEPLEKAASGLQQPAGEPGALQVERMLEMLRKGG